MRVALKNRESQTKERFDSLETLMTYRTFTILTFLLIFWCSRGMNQTLKALDSLEIQYQACLDAGKLMLGCSTTFYSQMDSLLNVRYKRLRSLCESIQKAQLKEEQLAWLSKIDKEFRRNKTEVHKELKKTIMVEAKTKQ